MECDKSRMNKVQNYIDIDRLTLFFSISFPLFYRSARTRRKAENKKWSLKEGSANEEFALVDALSKIIKVVDGLKGMFLCYIKL